MIRKEWCPFCQEETLHEIKEFELKEGTLIQAKCKECELTLKVEVIKE